MGMVGQRDNCPKVAACLKKFFINVQTDTFFPSRYKEIKFIGIQYLLFLIRIISLHHVFDQSSSQKQLEAV